MFNRCSQPCALIDVLVEVWSFGARNGMTIDTLDDFGTNLEFVMSVPLKESMPFCRAAFGC